MLHVSMLNEEGFDSEDQIKIYSDLVKDIYRVSKLYKRKSKKVRNSTIQAPNTRRKRIREARVVVNKNEKEEEGYDSDSSSVFAEEEVPNKENKPDIVVE